MSKRIGFIIWLYTFVIAYTTANRIQLYKNENFSGLVYESGSTLKCHNVPVNEKYNVRSIRTDTCTLVYMDPDCISTWSIKISHNSSYPRFWSIGSFQVCNDHEGGNQLNIDITEYFEKTAQKPKILESYTDVCDCIKIPDYVQEMEKWSINNHGNDLWAYYDSECLSESNAKFIRAGNSLESDMHLHRFQNGKNDKSIKSIGPILNSTYFEASCYPYSKLMRLELLEISFSSDSFPIKKDWLNDCNTDLQSTQLLTRNVDSIKFFGDTNFHDFLFESEAKTTCQNLPLPSSRRWVTEVIGSLMTDTCVLIYSEYNCFGRSVKLQAGKVSDLKRQWETTVTGPKTLSLIYATLNNWKWTTKSFHACHDKEGGAYLNVDITEYHRNISTHAKILETYKNVQSCHNVPKYIREMDKWSINNHGNPMIAYFEPDCLTNNFEPLWIPAGVSSFSIGLSSFKIEEEKTVNVHKIQSFSHFRSAELSDEVCNAADTPMPKLNFFKKLERK